MYHFSCPFQCYVQCSVILSSRYSIRFFANHHWNPAFSGNSEVLHTNSTTMYVRIPVFWNVTLCHSIIHSWCFERTGHLHLQSFKAHELSTLEGQTFVKIPLLIPPWYTIFFLNINYIKLSSSTCFERHPLIFRRSMMLIVHVCSLWYSHSLQVAALCTC